MLAVGVEKLQSLRGMVDLLPEQTALWQRVEACARQQFRRAALAEGADEVHVHLLADGPAARSAVLRDLEAA